MKRASDCELPRSSPDNLSVSSSESPLSSSLSSRQILFTAVGLIAVTLLGLLDYLTGPDLSFIIFYLVPVYLVSWYAGRWPGRITAIASTIAWYLADYLTVLGYSHPLVPYWNGLVKLAFLIATSQVIYALKSSLERERAMAGQDPLTNMLNRRLFINQAEKLLAHSRRYQHPFTIAYLDLDNFKTVNDLLGHHAGDALLCTVADSIVKNVRKTDLAARLGGDEFALLLPETGDIAGWQVLNKLQSQMLEIMQEKSWPVTISIGAVTFLSPPASVAEMLNRADTLMYSAKREGKNRLFHEIVATQFSRV